MIDEFSLTRIADYWAKQLGFARELLGIPNSIVLPCSDNRGAFIFNHHECYVWHIPERFMRTIKETLQATGNPGALFQEKPIAQLFSPATKLVLGPCPIAYCGANSLCTDRGMPPSRRLIESDRPSVETLAIACGKEAWKHGGVQLWDHRAVFGGFAQGELVAATSYEIWDKAIAHVGVVTAPAHRGKGFGKSVARAATHHALREGLMPQWRTLASNAASVGIGKSLGFTPWATHFFVRLAPEKSASGAVNS